jgi:hypothetical protein
MTLLCINILGFRLQILCLCFEVFMYLVLSTFIFRPISLASSSISWSTSLITSVDLPVITSSGWDPYCQVLFNMLPLGFTVILHMIFSQVKYNSNVESESQYLSPQTELKPPDRVPPIWTLFIVFLIVIFTDTQFLLVCQTHSMMSGSLYHGMACPQVADGGTASNMEGSCEYIE